MDAVKCFWERAFVNNNSLGSKYLVFKYLLSILHTNKAFAFLLAQYNSFTQKPLLTYQCSNNIMLAQLTNISYQYQLKFYVQYNTNKTQNIMQFTPKQSISIK